MDKALGSEIRSMGAACYALQARKTANLAARAYNALLAGHGLEITQFSTLAAVVQGEVGSVTELARVLGVDRSTMTRNLVVLDQMGLVRRKPEGRRVAPQPTDAGVAVVLDVLPRWRDMQARVEAALDPTAPDPRDGLKRLRAALRIAEASYAGEAATG